MENSQGSIPLLPPDRQHMGIWVDVLQARCGVRGQRAGPTTCHFPSVCCGGWSGLLPRPQPLHCVGAVTLRHCDGSPYGKPWSQPPAPHPEVLVASPLVSSPGLLAPSPLSAGFVQLWHITHRQQGPGGRKTSADAPSRWCTHEHSFSWR